MSLNLEEGKFYRLRNGKKVGPLVVDREKGLAGAPACGFSPSHWYTQDSDFCDVPGRSCAAHDSDEDIVAEWAPTVVVYTPEGYQVTTSAIGRLMDHFGCEQALYPWRKNQPVTPGALHITDRECKRGMIVADAVTGKPIEDFIVLSIHEALAAVEPDVTAILNEMHAINPTVINAALARISVAEPEKPMHIPVFATEEESRSHLDDLIDTCHNASYAAGWWHHPDTGLPYIPGDNRIVRPNVPQAWESLPMNYRDMIIHYWPFVVATKIGLFHSEVSEGFEAYRRGLRDDKLAHRLGLETEIADTMIRQFDLAGAFKRANALGVVDASTHEMDLSASFFEKLNFNKDRPDHKVAARRAAGGKMF